MFIDRCRYCGYVYYEKDLNDGVCMFCEEQYRDVIKENCAQCGKIFPLNLLDYHICFDCWEGRIL